MSPIEIVDTIRDFTGLYSKGIGNIVLPDQFSEKYEVLDTGSKCVVLELTDERVLAVSLGEFTSYDAQVTYYLHRIMSILSGDEGLGGADYRVKFPRIYESVPDQISTPQRTINGYTVRERVYFSDIQPQIDNTVVNNFRKEIEKLGRCEVELLGKLGKYSLFDLVNFDIRAGTKNLRNGSDGSDYYLDTLSFHNRFLFSIKLPEDMFLDYMSRNRFPMEEQEEVARCLEMLNRLDYICNELPFSDVDDIPLYATIFDLADAKDFLVNELRKEDMETLDGDEILLLEAINSIRRREESFAKYRSRKSA